MSLLTGRWAAVSAWAIVVLAVGIAVSFGNKPGKLYKTFRSAGIHFKNGETLYGTIPDDEDLYRYSPTIGASMVPWTILPMKAGAVLWRAFQAALLLLAIRAWAKIAVPEVPWPLLALLALPFVIGNIHNAQINPLIAAMMLFTAIFFHREQFWLAAVMIAIAALIKIYPLSLGLLLCVIEPRRFSLRLLIVLVIGCLLPFVAQNPDYVTQMYCEWFETAKDDDRTMQPMSRGYHDFQRLILRWGIDIPLQAYRGLEVVVGCAFAGLIAWGRVRGIERQDLIHGCVALGFIWCTLFGPSSESATYMLLGPLAAHAFLAVTGRAIWERVWVRGSVILLISMNIMQWFPAPFRDGYRAATIPQAHAALFLLIWIVWRFVNSPRTVHIPRLS